MMHPAWPSTSRCGWLRRWHASRSVDPATSSGLELHARRHLNAPRRLRGNGFSEEGRRHGTDVADVVHAVAEVEHVDRHGDAGTLARAARPELERAGPAQVDTQVVGA